MIIWLYYTILRLNQFLNLVGYNKLNKIERNLMVLLKTIYDLYFFKKYTWRKRKRKPIHYLLIIRYASVVHLICASHPRSWASLSSSDNGSPHIFTTYCCPQRGLSCFRWSILPVNSEMKQWNETMTCKSYKWQRNVVTGRGCVFGFNTSVFFHSFLLSLNNAYILATAWSAPWMHSCMDDVPSHWRAVHSS